MADSDPCLFQVVPWSVIVEFPCHTVDSEIFARVLFLRNFAHAKFRENKVLAKSFCGLLIQENHAFVVIFNVANMS